MMTQKPCRQGDRGADRFEVARGQGDNEPFDLARRNLRQLVGHRVDMPIRSKRRARTEHPKGKFDERAEIDREHGAQRQLGWDLFVNVGDRHGALLYSDLSSSSRSAGAVTRSSCSAPPV